MDSIFVEPLTGGLNTAKSPLMLEPGELIETYDVIYRFNCDGIGLAPPQLTFQAIGKNINGLVALNFDNGTSILVGQVNTASNVYKYQKATVGTSGTFADFSTAETVSPGDTLVSIPFENKYILLNGRNVNRVLKDGTTFRAHGLAPVTSPVGATVQTGGTWPLGTAGLGYFEYWATEVVDYGSGDKIESTVAYASGTLPTKVQITSATNYVLVTIHSPLANSNATHWRVYRSAVMTDAGDTLYPVGELVGELPIPDGTTPGTFTDGLGTSTAYTNAGTADSGIQLFPNATFGTGANMIGTATNGVFTTITTSAVSSILPGGDGYFTVSNIGITGVVAPVSGFEIKAAIKANHYVGARPYFQVSVDNGTSWGTRVPFPVYPDNTVVEASLGGNGQTEMWGVVFTQANVLNGSLKIRVGSSCPKGDTTSEIASIDYFAVKVYHNGTVAGSAEVFPIVSVTVEGESLSYPANGQPPTASTGDVFENALVTNDIANPSFVRWSLSGSPDYFPAPYFNDFETTDNDQVQCISTLGSRCMIGLRNSLWRMNYLPTANDASFDLGTAIDLVDPYHGIVGPRAACQYIGSEGRAELAFISATGLHTTDGFVTRPLCDALDWAKMLSPLWGKASLRLVELVNNPDNYELILWMPDTQVQASDSNNPNIWKGQYYHFNYHPRHLKEGGQLKATGPIDWFYYGTSGYSAQALALTSNVTGSHAIFYTAGSGSSGQTVRYSKEATSAGAWSTIVTALSNPIIGGITTRKISAGGLGGEWRAKELYVLPEQANMFSVPNVTQKFDLQVSGYVASVPGTVTDFGFTTYVAHNIDITGGVLNRFDADMNAENITFSISLGDTTQISTMPSYNLTYSALHIVAEDFGREDSKKP